MLLTASCIYVVICTFYIVLDPALIGLSLAYGVSLTGILQYSVQLSAEVENLVSYSFIVDAIITEVLCRWYQWKELRLMVN